MATRDLKTPGLASASTIPYGTLRKILELNTVADYEQLRKIAVALNIPLSEIVEDAERLASDPGVVDDFRESASSDTSKSPVVDEQSPEANHEDIDIDAWANRIKAEDSVHNN